MNCTFAFELPILRSFDKNRMHFCISQEYTIFLIS